MAPTLLDVPRPDVPLVFSARGLSYAVKTKNGVKNILSDVSFDIKSGQVLILMGPSGAGKTSLLDLLTVRSEKKRPGVSGTVTLNGVPLSSIISTHCAYVEQFSKLWAFLTPRELIRTASRFYCRSQEEAAKREESMIQLTGLTDCADVKCGNEFFAGLSGGQKRRVSTAEALVKSPVVIFMDEPMSGLDSAAADNIMDLVYRTAEEMKTIIILTMHQPSTAMFLRFQHVLMLTRGEIAYLGPGASLGQYCETSLNAPVPYGVNPCDHFLRLINPDFVGADKAAECVMAWKAFESAPQINPVEVFSVDSKTLGEVIPWKRHSAKKRASQYMAASRNVPLPPARATVGSQACLLLRRQARLILRDPSLYTGRMVFYFVSNLFFAIVYIGVRDLNQRQVFPRLLILMWFISVPCNLAIITVHGQSTELELITKEVRNGMYSPALYLTVTSLLQIPMIVLLVLFAIVVPGFAVAKLHFDNALELCLVIFLIFSSFEAAAQFCAAAFRNPLIGMMIFINWWFASFLFCGFLIDPEDVFWPLQAFTYIVPFNWGIKAMALVEFRDAVFSGAVPVSTDVSPIGFVCPDVPPMQCYGKYGSQVLASLHANYKVVEEDADYGLCCLILLGTFAMFKFGFFVLTMIKCR